MDRVVSVIVPIYNVEAYLTQCLDSLVNQTYQNLEIVLIDDGSLDRCPQICDEYAAKDTRIKVVHKENGGLSSARNAGLDIAIGDYIAFVDSDDWVETDAYSVLAQTIECTNADIVTCGINKIMDGKSYPTSSNDGNCTVIDNFTAIRYIPDEKRNVRFEVWNKLFKRAVIGDIRFKNKQIYEDVFFDRNVFLKAKTIAVINRNLYDYRMCRPGSTVSFFKENRFSIFSELDSFSEELKSVGQLKLAKSFQLYAIETAMSFYLDIKQLKARREFEARILSLFDTYYKQFSIVERIKSPKLILFKLSPRAYSILRNIKQ